MQAVTTIVDIAKAARTTHHRAVTTNPRRGADRAITSHFAWYKISVRPETLFVPPCCRARDGRSTQASKRPPTGPLRRLGQPVFADFPMLSSQRCGGCTLMPPCRAIKNTFD